MPRIIVVSLEVQDADVLASGLDWVVVQPVHLTDDDDDTPPTVSTDGTMTRPSVSRRSVGRVLAQAVAEPAWVGRSLSVSGA